MLPLLTEGILILKMVRKKLALHFKNALDELIKEGHLPRENYDTVEITEPKNAQHGDYACNFALMAAKKAQVNPRDLGVMFQKKLLQNPSFEKVEVAGPGFINLTISPLFLIDQINEFSESALPFGWIKQVNPKKINVEFVSVNPNGPITVGSGRGAAFGDTLCRVLEAAGHQVHREFYINDSLNSLQMDLFAESVIHYIKEALGQTSTFPENGYKGEYVKRIAEKILEETKDQDTLQNILWVRNRAETLMIESQRRDLEKFGVKFDTWFSEQELHDSGEVENCLKLLDERGVTEYKEEALWLKSTLYGDDKDRVLIRTGGSPTYIASDVAYHKNKFERGFDELIDILGPDHHGYIGRMKAGIQALGYSPEQLKVIIFQVVRFLKDGKPAPMRKRDGNIYELADLIDEIGADVTRFFYLMRSHDTSMDFDIDLAVKHSDENPVFYTQYAYARICSILNKAKQEGLLPSNHHLQLLIEPSERALLKKVLDLSDEIQRSADHYGVHRLTNYAIELARSFHHFYDKCRAIQKDQPELSSARLYLCEFVQKGFKSTFDLLGISAPEKMERNESSA